MVDRRTGVHYAMKVIEKKKVLGQLGGRRAAADELKVRDRPRSREVDRDYARSAEMMRYLAVVVVAGEGSIGGAYPEGPVAPEHHPVPPHARGRQPPLSRDGGDN